MKTGSSIGTTLAGRPAGRAIARRAIALTNPQARRLNEAGAELDVRPDGSAVVYATIDQLARLADLGDRYDLRHRSDLFGDLHETFVSWLCELNPAM